MSYVKKTTPAAIVAKVKAKAAPKFSKAQQTLLATASVIGEALGTNYAGAVKLFVKVASNPALLSSVTSDYQAGFVMSSLLQFPDYVAKWRRLSRDERLAANKVIMGRSPPKLDSKGNFKPDSQQPDGFRNAREERACRNASSSASRARKEAGIVSVRTGKGGPKTDESGKATNGRAPRTGSNPPDAPAAANDADKPLRDALFVSPKFKVEQEARDYFSNAIAALAATCERNRTSRGIKKEVSHVAFLVESIITDAKAAIAKALGV